MTLRSLALLIMIAATAADANAADLQADTIAAFDRYVKLTEARMDGELKGPAPFLWLDQLPPPDRKEAHRRLQRGDFVVSRLATLDGKREIDIPHGIVHHWIGTILIPGVTVDRVIALMQDYERYQSIYAPNVRQSRTTDHQGDRYTVYLQLFMKKVISVVLNTSNDVHYARLSPHRAQVRSYSTRIAELQDADGGAHTELPVGQDSGFLWRFNNYCSLDEQSEGTYVQCESLSLSRGIPAGFGWLVGPFVTSIPRETLEFTLGHMRSALTASR